MPEPAAPIRSACPYDCPDTCGLLVQVVGGAVVSVQGDPDHPHSRGTLCGKMAHYERTVHSPRRLETPLLASGPKGSGRFTPIGWDEAIQRITDRWRRIIAEHGAEAILPYSYAGTMGLVQRNAGHAFFHRLGASRLERTICSPAKAAGWAAVMGGTPALSQATMAKSDLILIWGQNSLATNLHGQNWVREARRAGARTWLIDTYQAPTAAAVDRTLVVRPGSDGALALGLMHILVRDGRQDQAFIDAHVQGYPELVEQVLPGFTPARVAEWTGVPVPDLELLAREFGKALAPFILVGSGLSRYGNGAMNVRAIACLPALVGAWAKEGGGGFAGVNDGGGFPLAEITREDFLPGPVRTVNMVRLGHALEELDHPRIMGLYVYHANPAAVNPDQNAVLRGLARADLFTVVHERFLTDTALHADLVLPATSSMEHSDLYRSYGSYCIQRVHPAIPPVGESRSNWDVFGALAQAMGFPEPFFRQSADQLIDHVVGRRRSGPTGVDWEAFDAGRAVEARPAGIGTWRTPSGRIEILNPRLDPPLPAFLPRHAEADPLPFSLMTAPSLHSLNSSFQERDELRGKAAGMRLQMNPGDAADRGLAEGQDLVVFNPLGEVDFQLTLTDRVPRGVVVAEGVWWREFAPGARNVNALTAQRLTDMGGGSTFYDNRVDVRARA